MIESLADIEALTLQCRSEQSKEYITEAVLCYRSGAYRAAIVSVWIAVVFDLIDKIRELALSGDASARALEKKYETYLQQIDVGNEQGITSALEFERNILFTCVDTLQLFDRQQFIDLQRLREDRHRCAHPSFQKIGEPYRPSAEQARLHLRNAVLHVLSEPPVQAKAALVQLVKIVGSAYFPEDGGKALTQLKSTALQRATPSLVRGFVDQLLFDFFDEKSVLFYNKNVIAALSAVFEMYPAAVEERLAKQLSKVVRDVPDKKFAAAVVLVGRLAFAWALLDQPARDKLIEYIRNARTSELIKVLFAVSGVATLQPEVASRVSRLNLEELGDAIVSHRLGALGKSRALELLSQVKSWGAANDVINRTVLPIFGELNKADVERIIKMPVETGADLPGAHSYQLLIDEVRKTKMFAEPELDLLLEENRASYLVPKEET